LIPLLLLLLLSASVNLLLTSLSPSLSPSPPHPQGDAGYILIERSDKDLCGVLMAASYPTM